MPGRIVTNTRELPALARAKEPDSWRVIFQVVAPGTPAIGVEVNGVALVGRSDETSGFAPHLDLSPYGAADSGVSRQHAILLPSDEGLYLIDLDSTNGTWINGQRLAPGQKYLLRSGARVEFGTLRLMVRVVGALRGGISADGTEVVARRI